MKKIKLLDCTIRDGGYLNSWDFSEDFAFNLCSAISESSVEYIEVGFLTKNHSSDLMPWQSLDAQMLAKLQSAIRHYPTKLVALLNYGDMDISDIPHRSSFPLDFIRIAAHKAEKVSAVSFAKKVKGLGYTVSVNFMGISNYSEEDVDDLAELIADNSNCIDYFYIADSFGALTPERTELIIEKIKNSSDAKLGFHPHNNLQLAFANSLQAIKSGIDILDGSVLGMGRGAGNLAMETIVAFFEKHNTQHSVLPILKFADVYMSQMKGAVKWGYSLPQLLSGILSLHPNYPTNLLKRKHFLADDIYKILQCIDEKHIAKYSEEALKEAINKFQKQRLSEHKTFISDSIKALAQTAKKVVLICGGISVVQNKAAILEYIRENNTLVFSVNHFPEEFDIDGIFYGNRRRIDGSMESAPGDIEFIFGTSIISTDIPAPLKKISHLTSHEFALYRNNEEQNNSLFILNSGIEALVCLFSLGFTSIELVGLDGYSINESSLYYYSEKDDVKDYATKRYHNQAIENELKLLSNLIKNTEYSFKIITPTLFEQHYEPVLTSIKA